MTELNLEDIGRRVKNIREALILTQTEFSEKLSISKNSVLLLEKGEKKCLLDFVYNLSAIFKVNLYYLFHGKGGFFASHSGKPPKDVNPGAIDNYEQLLWYLKRSPFMRNALFEFSSKYLYNNEALMRLDVEKSKYRRTIPLLDCKKFDAFQLVKFGKRVRRIREHLKLTQKQLADSLKKSRSNIFTIESGKGKCGFDMLYLITEIYGVDIYYLIHGVGEMYRHQSASIPGGKEIGEAVNSMEQLKWYLEASPLLLHASISQAIKIQYENESVILKDLENYGSRD